MPARCTWCAGAGQAGTTPQVFHLNAKNPVALAYAESFPLLPRDVVFVDSSTVARFGRVVSTIVPAAASVATAGAQIGIALKR